MKPRLLDLFSGAGGAGTGYARAGFDVTGVDLVPQPRYPFSFVQADALEYLAKHSREYDVIAASPPCQRYTGMQRIHGNGAAHPDLIGPTRQMLETIGRPYVIENVAGAPLRGPITLCGVMFGLKTYRHRLFESNCLLLEPYHPPHPEVCPPAGRGASPSGYMAVCGGGAGGGLTNADKGRAMGIGWMIGRELAEAIPPSYTEYVGRFLLGALK